MNEVVQQEDLVPLDHAETRVVRLAGYDIKFSKAPRGKLLDISNRLKNSGDFHGSPYVNYVIEFKGMFDRLIGVDTQQLNPNVMENMGMHVIEDFSEDAQNIALNLTQLANQIINNPSLYNDTATQNKYIEFIRHGYNMLKNHFGIDPNSNFISLIRAGAVCLRLALGTEKNAVINNEIPIITKRTQLDTDGPTDMTVTVKWHGDVKKLQSLHRNKAVIVDTVLASGASIIAAALALADNHILLREVEVSTIVATTQGMKFLKQVLGEMRIYTQIHTLAKAVEMSDHFYLEGQKAVADAGQIMREMVPDIYK